MAVSEAGKEGKKGEQGDCELPQQAVPWWGAALGALHLKIRKQGAST